MKKISTLFLLLISITFFGQTNCDVTNPSNNLQNGRQCSANGNWSVANDIIVPAETELTLNAFMPSIGMTPGITAQSALVKIYNDANGLPGTVLNTQNIVPTSHTFQGNQFGMDFHDVLLDLTPFSLQGSATDTRYWVSVQITTSNNSTAYFEITSQNMIGEPLTFSDGGGFVIPDAVEDGVYTFFSDCVESTDFDFPYPYCGPMNFGTVEPITLVEVTNINNSSSAAINGSPSHENFTNITGIMEQGKSYPITLKGNTAGNYMNTFLVFIDWNQDNVFEGDDEIYFITELTNSTGIDNKIAEGIISVPNDALLGTTRMRIKKTYDGPHMDPCEPQVNWGQTEDYSIEVSENLGVIENNALVSFSFYPNPANEFVYLKAAKKIENVTLYNFSGQKIMSIEVSSNSTQLNIAHLKAGTYVMKVNVDGEVGTFKLIKK